MAPRLSHKKTRTGCKRCKARKVKCSEERPKCNACARHNVECEYPVSPYGDAQSPSVNGGASDVHGSQMLELRLMHEWMAFACYSLTTTWETWKYHAPMVAFEHRYVLDAMLALAALHASRLGMRYWSSLQGKILADPNDHSSVITIPGTELAHESNWKGASQAMQGQPPAGSVTALNADPNGNMLEISRKYFAKALEGQQRAVATMGSESQHKPIFMSSVLVSAYSLFTLSEGVEETDSLMLDPMRWFRLSRGTTVIVEHWQATSGQNWLIEAGGMYGDPDLSDSEELFRPEHREPFKYLLTPVQGDVIVDEDREAYEHTLSYIGLIYKGIAHGWDVPLASSRRVLAMPSRVPNRFIELVEANQPRALAMLAHAFASLKLAEARFPWFRGIAQRQVPIVCRALPESWSVMIQWPLEMVKDNPQVIMPS